LNGQESVLQTHATSGTRDDGEAVHSPVGLVDGCEGHDPRADGEDGGSDDDEDGILAPPLYDATDDKTQDYKGEHEGQEL